MTSKTGSKKLKCPYCTGRYPTETNNLAVVRPEVAKYFHPTKNHPLTAYDFTPKSNQKIWWLCENGHEWRIRAGSKKGCSRCSMSATSKIERLLREAIIKSNLFSHVYDESAKLSIRWRKNSSMTVDILCDLNEDKFAFEYDGYYYHSGKMSKSASADLKKDTEKTQALIDAGYYVVRLREINPAGTLEMLPIADRKLLQIHHKYDQTVIEPFTDTIKVISAWFATLK